MRKPSPVGDKTELLLRPIKNFDVSRRGFEGLHQLRVFADITPGVSPKSGVFVILANQQQRPDTELKPQHPAWYTGQLCLDAVPVKFLDLDKLYRALENAKRLHEEYETEHELPQQAVARIQIPRIKPPTFRAQ